ncbi:alternate-type signal peptide domain-containing protein [Williamsia sterculiae]|uniref:Alternate signal-mediated exported protein, RER_14450 family n=1 Tax=Williamsia sterculiae TaxID=1344003 RepID=A0A1N7HAZ4_9NOCA|nr:alternate-type signal peptide domain-containing protein [Williamsia sterculiae]SIS21943.1 alternate signal-mediated exported protein, RER_14450 family [Williamsia sterculiae]
MNRSAKGALAAGAAVVVLLGGAGSYALWSDSGASTPGNLSTGQLKLTAQGAAAWKDVSADGIIGGTTINPATDLLVPKDTWEYTTTYNALATGKNMKAQVTVNPGTAGTLPEGVTVTPTATVDGASATTGTAVTITPGAARTVVVKVTVAFADVTGQTSQNAAVNVSNLSVSLNQVRP